MTSIVQRILDDGTDMKAQLSNSQFARKHSLPTGWTHCRIGIRWQMNDIGGNISGSPKFYLGLCNGSGNLFFDATTDNFLGIVLEGNTWTFDNSVAPTYNPAVNNTHWYKKSGTVSTQLNILADPKIQTLSSGNTTMRSVLFLDYERTGTNVYTTSGLYKNSATSGDVLVSSFYYQMATRSPAIGLHTSFSRNVLNNISEVTGGLLDTVCCGWNKIVPEIEISDICVTHLD